MRNLVIVGSQWGDEGKGKYVDLLTGRFDCAVRYQGGHNAGHTVRIGPDQTILHLVPSGILRPNTLCAVGDGVVVEPCALVSEMDMLSEKGIRLDGRFFVGNRAHLVLPLHRAMDRWSEEARGRAAIGTTLRGIGPAYTDKYARVGVRAGHVRSRTELRAACHEVIVHYRRTFGPHVPELVSGEEWDRFHEACARLAPFVADTAQKAHEWSGAGKSILFEGAQGVMLDVDFGTYPYVTSSHTFAGGVSAGTGMPNARLGAVAGVMKAYTTRVGGGPFPTELKDDLGEAIRRKGGEYGASTGRPRRCGWLDLFQMRYSCMINGFDTLLLTKIDVLDGLDPIRVAVGYRLDGRELETFPFDIGDLERVEAVYETFPGWKGSSAGVRDFDALPPEARDYIRFVARSLGVEVGMISTGSDRDETLLNPEASVIREFLG